MGMELIASKEEKGSDPFSFRQRRDGLRPSEIIAIILCLPEEILLK